MINIKSIRTLFRKDTSMEEKSLEEILDHYGLYVCTEHLLCCSDHQRYWKNGIISNCSYCQKRSRVIKVSEMADLISPSIFQRYCYNPALGMWQRWYKGDNDTTLTTEHLLQRYGLYCNEELTKDLSYSLVKSFLTKQPSAPEEIITIRDWQSFTSIVKNKRRFTFISTDNQCKNNSLDSSCSNILYSIGDLIRRADLETYLNLKDVFYRAREIQPESKKENYEFSDITCPPEQYTKQCRMSPAGVSMFYAAFEEKTALDECIKQKDGCIIVGEFNLKKPIRVIDLTQIHRKSVFHPDYDIYEFLVEFRDEISKPISEKDKDIDYVPSQVVTEFFRWIYRSKDGLKVYGIVYESSTKLKKCSSLF